MKTLLNLAKNQNIFNLVFALYKFNATYKIINSQFFQYSLTFGQYKNHTTKTIILMDFDPSEQHTSISS